MNFLQKALGFDPSVTTTRTEIIAGATTFLTMSYILAVNPTILATTGMDKGALFTATALASAIATLLLAFMARLPFAQAPSMGLNAFFAFTLCQAMHYTWQQSLAIMFVEGVIFLLLTFLNVREMILNSIPKNLRYAISAGIGMFIAFIGLKNAEIIVPKEGTFVGEHTPRVPAGGGIVQTGLGLLRGKRYEGRIILSGTGTVTVALVWGPGATDRDSEQIHLKQTISSRHITKRSKSIQMRRRRNYGNTKLICRYLNLFRQSMNRALCFFIT